MHKASQHKPTTVLVIGAGLGGLGLAQGLMKAGFKVKVFERDKSSESRIQGYRITMRSLGMSALKALLPPDLLKHLSDAKVNDIGNGFTFANEKMEPLLKIESGQDAATQLLRSELRKLLLENVDIEWNKRVTSIEDKDQVTVHFDDGSKAVGDFLVACDGGSSTVRSLLTTCKANSLSIPQVRDVGQVVYTAQIDRTPEWESLLSINRSGMARFLGPGTTYMGVTFSERADRSPTIFWGITEKIKDKNAPWLKFDESSEHRRQILEHCKKLINEGPWHEILKKLVNATPIEGILVPWNLRTSEFSNHANKSPMVPSGRITLLGDAAHIMPPGQGLGGSNVLEDARLLTELLAASQDPIDWKELTGKYEHDMFQRVKKVVEDSNNTEESHKRIRMIPLAKKH